MPALGNETPSPKKKETDVKEGPSAFETLCFADLCKIEVKQGSRTPTIPPHFNIPLRDQDVRLEARLV